MGENTRVIAMAQSMAARSPEKFVIYGLGSCVGISLYDPKAKVGGLAHPMLPSSLYYSNPTARSKYVDTALDDLLAEVRRLGAGKDRLEAKMAGGAAMFTTLFGQ